MGTDNLCLYLHLETQRGASGEQSFPRHTDEAADKREVSDCPFCPTSDKRNGKARAELGVASEPALLAVGRPTVVGSPASSAVWAVADLIGASLF